MAGDWIKMRADLLTHPKVVRMMSALKTDKYRTVGGLLSVWCLFDAHSEDGQLSGYTIDTLDEMAAWPGFSQAMASVGWLIIEPESLELPRFDAHNGQSAKRRAQEADRKKAVRKSSASSADKKRTREEKRREDIDNPVVPCPIQEIVDLYHDALPDMPAVVKMTDKRAKILSARWGGSKNCQTLDWWAAYFQKVASSDFLMGKTAKPFHGCDFEWLITEGNFIKVVEGRYDNR